MRTNIDIDDELMAAAMQAGGYATKRETVEAGLRMLAQRRRAYADALALGGRIDWQGDLDAWRRDKPSRGAVWQAAEPASPAYAATSKSGRSPTKRLAPKAAKAKRA
ncbi:type II toxin-antitoxin system VapB family antitoxin [Hylemonella sp. W303a]|uniref:type II toxin-antitoxin system VapB family antitoxin n=1 Tax=Hylemonella sp. W303a TaxID=3389873 RepID=UPI00396AF981